MTAQIDSDQVQAFAIPMQLDLLAGQSDLLAFLNRLDCGAIILSRNAEVAAWNVCAEAHLSDGLSVIRKRLVTALPAYQPALDQLLQAAFNPAIDTIGSMALPRPSGKRALVLQVVPLGGDGEPDDTTTRSHPVLLVVYDLERRSRSPNKAALGALGLTPAEISIAAHVGCGLSPQETSDRLNLSVHTVRAHLKKIYGKLDLRNQADLVQLVTKIHLMR